MRFMYLQKVRRKKSNGTLGIYRQERVPGRMSNSSSTSHSHQLPGVSSDHPRRGCVRVDEKVDEEDEDWNGHC